jgi:hypothetical protein
MSEWFAFGAIGATIAAVWSYIKAGWEQFFSLFIVNVTLTDDAAWVVRHCLCQHYRPLFLGARHFYGANWFVRSVNRTETVVIEDLANGGRFYYRGWRLLWVSKGGGSQAQSNGARSTSERSAVTLSITYFRWTLNLEQWLKAATKAYNTGEQLQAAQGCLIYHHFGTAMRPTDFGGLRNSSSGPYQGMAAYPVPMSESVPLGLTPITHARDDLGRTTAGSQTFNDLAYPADILGVIASIRDWLSARDWYESRRIPWRMGLLLVGGPGTGKTSLVRATAAELLLPVHAIHLASMFDDELDKIFREMSHHTPCIALLEDVDSVFEGRKALAKISFDALLNCIDGIDSVNGLLLIMTTNRPEQLDNALAGGGTATRPGRIDRVVHFHELDEAGRRKLVGRILVDYEALHDELVAEGEGMTGAQFQGLCISKARELAPCRKKLNGFPYEFAEAVGRLQTTALSDL